MHSFVILAYKRKGVFRQNVQTNKKVMHIYAVKLQDHTIQCFSWSLAVYITTYLCCMQKSMQNVWVNYSFKDKLDKMDVCIG